VVPIFCFENLGLGHSQTEQGGGEALGGGGEPPPPPPPGRTQRGVAAYQAVFVGCGEAQVRHSAPPPRGKVSGEWEGVNVPWPTEVVLPPFVTSPLSLITAQGPNCALVEISGTPGILRNHGFDPSPQIRHFQRKYTTIT